MREGLWKWVRKLGQVLECIEVMRVGLWRLVLKLGQVEVYKAVELLSSGRSTVPRVKRLCSAEFLGLGHFVSYVLYAAI